MQLKNMLKATLYEIYFQHFPQQNGNILQKQQIYEPKKRKRNAFTRNFAYMQHLFAMFSFLFF